ncbi:NlpC/P60 family protein [Rheinheimera maricola]|uniref:TIGR02594 family protein n=1 Tax=Rheinheimera maricola TaxID=2793282 RepID=A0ABS7X7A2_9GAMM|nr:TIGR02594 family protein [Rheinheimera maricola]MBZ9611045.1 TIGR02594 family protein [Rheinheimera maricola]
MTNLRITGSVGISGQNNVNDVKAVQLALNSLGNLLSATKKLVVDGRLGTKPETTKTVAAIKLFQQQHVGMAKPDGKIDVNGNSQRKLNALLAAEVSNTTKPVVLPTTTAYWLKTAEAEIGQKEVAGTAANPRILEYFSAGKFWGTDDSGAKNAWCGCFVAWVMKQHGFEPVKNAFRAKEWVNFGKQISTPVSGAIGIKSRSGGGHVAFVVGQSADGSHLYMLGGNQGNSVQISRYKKDVWDHFVVPASYNTDNTTLPIYTGSADNAGSEA